VGPGGRPRASGLAGLKQEFTAEDGEVVEGVGVELSGGRLRLHTRCSGTVSRRRRGFADSALERLDSRPVRETTKGLPVSWIGIDLGGTKIYAVVFDGDGVLAEAKSKTPTQGGPLAVVDAMAAVVRDLGPIGDVVGIGVGAPGVIDPVEGTVRQAPNLPGWMEPFGVAEALSAALDGVPVALDNDVNVGTLAEHRLGAGKGADNLIGVFAGTGIGAGVVLDGVLRHGPTGAAGEIGHMIVRRGGRLCGCGGRGHLEAYAGRAAMERRARDLERKGRDTILVDLAPGRRMTSGVFVKALAAGDAVAIELIDDAVGALGVAIASATSLLDVPLVIVGGGLADRLGQSFVQRVEQACRTDVFPRNPELRIVPASLGDRGGSIGAALMAADRIGVTAEKKAAR
jgi:glucokinase